LLVRVLVTIYLGVSCESPSSYNFTESTVQLSLSMY